MHNIYKLQLDLNYGQDFFYDVSYFKKEYIRALTALKNKDACVAKSSFKTMVKLYKGNYLSSFYSDWCRNAREELRRNYIFACNQLAHFAQQNNRIEDSAYYLKNILNIDKYEEETYYKIINLYIIGNQKELAYRYYCQYLQVFTNELNFDDNDKIRSIYNANFKNRGTNLSRFQGTQRQA